LKILNKVFFIMNLKEFKNMLPDQVQQYQQLVIIQKDNFLANRIQIKLAQL